MQKLKYFAPICIFASYPCFSLLMLKINLQHRTKVLFIIIAGLQIRCLVIIVNCFTALKLVVQLFFYISCNLFLTLHKRKRQQNKPFFYKKRKTKQCRIICRSVQRIPMPVTRPSNSCAE